MVLSKEGRSGWCGKSQTQPLPGYATAISEEELSLARSLPFLSDVCVMFLLFYNLSVIGFMFMPCVSK